jgi:DNA-binding transcriptional ArsR family regulator
MPQPAALDAIGDATRRSLLDLLRAGPRSVGDLADRLPVSQPAVSQHLAVLLAAGLVSVRKEGRRRLYALRPEGLAAVRTWIDSFWTSALGAYRASFDTESHTGGRS